MSGRYGHSGYQAMELCKPYGVAWPPEPQMGPALEPILAGLGWVVWEGSFWGAAAEITGFQGSLAMAC